MAGPAQPTKTPTVRVRFTEDTRVNLGEGKQSEPYRAGREYTFAEPTANYWIGRGVAVPVGPRAQVSTAVEAPDGGEEPDQHGGLEGMSIAELRALAGERKIDLGRAQTKPELLAVIKAVLDAQQ